jgi:uncharacterized membrane protein YeaQ/YmgE (transglycosylase-associated protein family)
MPDTSAAVLGQHPIGHWLLAIAVGALFGALGQGVRTIPGTYKRSEKGEGFSLQVLLLSLLVGAVAGVLASLFLVTEINANTIAFSPLLGLMAAGYAGADFIEGFAGRWMRQGTPAAAPPPPTAPDPTRPDAGGAVG